MRRLLNNCNRWESIRSGSVARAVVLAVLLAAFAIVSPQDAIAQCGLTGFIETGVGQNRVPPCGTSTSILLGPGTQTSFQVKQGAIYEFSTCSSAWDTELTGRTGANAQLFYNDDNGPLCAGTRASVSWTASFTGTAFVVLTEFACNGAFSSGGVSAELAYRQVNNVAIASTPPANLCTGTNYTLTGTPNNDGTGTFSGPNVSGNTFNAAAAGTYVVTYTYGQCSATQSITVKARSTAATGITRSPNTTTICNGSSITLTRTGGSLGTNASWQWYTGPNGTGTNVGSGNAITVSPSANTTYYVRAEGDCGNTADFSVAITVNQPSVAPSSVNATNDTICEGASTQLSITGGSAGTGATLRWYTGPNGTGSTVGTGTPITVSPASTTTYYARYEGTCNSTADASRQIIVRDSSTIADSIVSTNGTLFCVGSANTTLSVSGGALGTNATWNWYSGSCGGTFLGSGPTIGVNPTTTTTYYVRAEGTCNNTLCVQKTLTVSTGLAISGINTTPVTCNGGADGRVGLSGRISGGIPPFTYFWSNGATTDSVIGLSATNYSVTVTDVAGCTISASGTVSQPTAIVISNVASSSIDCNGAATGTIDVFASGGTSPLFYSIDSGFTYQSTFSYTGLSAGTYHVFVQDNNGCVAAYSSNPVVLTQPTPLDLTVGATQNAACAGVNNGSITVTATGGTVPYGYSLNGGAFQPGPTFSALPAGSYLITVRDNNNCEDTVSAAISNATVLALAVDTIVDLACNGDGDGSFTVTASNGTAPYEYSINGIIYQSSGTFSSLNGGSYIVQARDALGCTANTTVNVVEPDELVITIDSVAHIACNGDSSGSIFVTVTGGTQGTYTGTGSTTTFVPFAANTVSGSSFTDGTWNAISGGVLSGRPFAGGTCCSSLNISGLTEIVPFEVDATGSYTITSTWGGFDGYLHVFGDPLTYTISGGIVGSYLAGNDDFGGFGGSQVTLTLTAGNTYYLIHSTFDNSAGGSYSTVISGPGNAGVTQSVPGSGTTAYQFNWSNGFSTEDLEDVLAGTYTVTVTDTNGCVAFASATINQPPALNVTLADSSEVSCNGGSDGELDISVTGGTPPYTFAWTGGNTTEDNINLTAGNYTVTVTDANGCENVQTFTLNQPPVLAASAVLTDPTCAGTPDGAIDLTVTGGTPPYFFEWSNNQFTEDLTGLAAGVYRVEVTDANGCVLIGIVTLSDASLLAITVDSVNSVLCAGDTTGFVDVTVTGGVPGGGACASTEYEFELTLNFDNFPSETGWSLVDDNTSTIYAVRNANFYAGLGGQTVVESVCLPAGADVTLTITDSYGDGMCCTFGIGSYSATVNGSTVASGGSFGFNDPTSFSTPQAGASPYTFAWSNGDTTEDLTNVGAGTYTLTVTAPGGCSVTETVTVTESPQLDLTETVTQVACFGDSTGAISVVASGGNTSGGLVPGNVDVVIDITFDDFPGEVSWSLVDAGNATVYGSTSPGDYTGAVTATETVSVPSGTALTFTIFDTYGDGLAGLFAPPGFYSVTIGGTTVASGGGNYGFADVSNFTAPTVLVPGPSGGYQYTWSTGDTTAAISSLPVGTYSVTVSDDNGCEYSETYTITQPDSITIQATTTDVNCNGRSNGSIATTVAGGVAPFTYLWSNASTTSSINNLAAGTYALTVTDANGCERIDSFVVNEPPALVVTMSGTPVSCNAGSDGTATATVTGGTAPYSYFWNVSQTTATATGLPAGTYTVLVTDGNGCTANGSYTVTQPTPIAAVDTITNVSCFGGADGEIGVALSGGTPPFNIAWSNGPTALATLTTTNGGLTAGTYTLSATDANGCAFTATYTVTQPDSLVLSGTVSDVTCNGGTDGAIDLTVVGGTSPYTYAWTPAGGTVQDPSALAAGVYTVVVTDDNGCTATWSATVNEPTIITIQASIDSVSCNGGNDGAIYPTVTGGTPGYTYTWADGPTTLNRTALSAGLYTLSVTDNNNCVISESFTVGEPAALATSIVTTNVDCFGGATGDIDLTVTGGTQPYTFLWSNFQTSEDIGSLTAGLYTVIVTDANGCQTIDTVTITQNPELVITGTSTNVTCFGFDDGTATVVVTGGVSPYSYAWSNGDVTDTADSLAPGLVTVVVTDDVGCTATASYTITSPDSLGLTAAVTNVTCNSDSNGAIDVAVTGGTMPYTYLWSNGATSQDLSGLSGGIYVLTTTDDNGCSRVDSFEVVEPDSLLTSTSGSGVTCFGFGNGSAGVTVTGGTPPYTYFWSNFRFTQTIYNLDQGEYFVIVTDANGCTTVDSVEVFEPAILNITGNVKESGCFGEEKGIVDITVTGGTLPYTYDWSTGDTTEDLFNLAAGQYSVTVTDANGCVDSFSAVVLSLPQPNADFAYNLACEGQEVAFLNNSNIPNGSIVSYDWTFGAGLGFSTDENPSFTFETSGNVNVTLVVTSDRGCKDTVVQTFFVNPTPDANIYALGDTLDVCTADSIVLSVEELTGLSYTWSNGDTTFNTLVKASGVYYVTVVSAVGCASYDSIDIGIYNSALVTASPLDTTVSLGFSAQLTATGGISYEWSPTETLDDPTSATPLATPLENTTYTVTVTVSPGCTGVRQVTVNVVEDFLVLPPNIFTPNGDGIHDRWVIANIVTYPICEVMVFNRWGGEIFSRTDYQNDWDGTNNNGKPLDDGTYYYILKCGDQIYKGDITILR